MDFNTIYKEYENTKNVCEFCKTYASDHVAIRFLLIRSLDKGNLKDIIQAYSTETAEGNIKELTEKVFNSSITVNQLTEYIETKRSELITTRENELTGLPKILENFPVVTCGVRNDRVDDIVKSFVRDKSMKTMVSLEEHLDNDMLPRIRQYVLWSYYNQTSNDIIELFFLKHKAIIPTLRKIHDIDFFVKIGDEIIPFDLKFTHISDEYFNLASKGILKNTSPDVFDDFIVSGGKKDKNEIQKIKEFYQSFKKKHRVYNLPNMKGLEKGDLLDELLKTQNSEAIAFVNRITIEHAHYVPSDSTGLYPLEWWNYKYQGERLFCNNNRLFVFLAYKNKFVDGRELKGKTSAIGAKISELLDNITKDKIHTIHYHYDKDPGLVGDYTALSLSTIYSE